MDKYLNTEQKLEYFKRLITPYETKGKVGKKKYFITQYLDADGHELSKKFWSKHSSSRWAFELFSWMANENCILNFEFEYKLQCLKGSNKKPNMDVFFETDDTIYFIESIFTEKVSPTLNKLSDAYYCELGNENLHTKNPYTLVERYREVEGYKDLVAFIKDVDSMLKDQNCDAQGWHSLLPS